VIRDYNEYIKSHNMDVAAAAAAAVVVVVMVVVNISSSG
jgi:hypothetical protein